MFPADLLPSAANVDLVIFDVDGVLTDGKLYYTDNGEEMKAFQVQDGSAIKMLRQQGVEVAIITGRDSAIVARRAHELGIPHVYQGAQDKAVALDRLVASTGIDAARMAHVGDDLPDLVLFDRVGLSISVHNAHPVVAAAADYVTGVAGGQGVARELCQLILTAKGQWPYP